MDTRLTLLEPALAPARIGATVTTPRPAGRRFLPGRRARAMSMVRQALPVARQSRRALVRELAAHGPSRIRFGSLATWVTVALALGPPAGRALGAPAAPPARQAGSSAAARRAQTPEPGNVQAPREAARAFLERIYGRYLDEHAPPLLWSDTDAASVFEPALAAAIVKDSDDAGRRGGISDLLDYDPFVVGQDYQISGLTIDVVRATGRSAGARVRFRNLGRPLEIQFDLTSLRGEWRIRDMRREGWSLRSLYGLKD